MPISIQDSRVFQCPNIQMENLRVHQRWFGGREEKRRREGKEWQQKEKMMRTKNEEEKKKKSPFEWTKRKFFMLLNIFLVFFLYRLNNSIRFYLSEINSIGKRRSVEKRRKKKRQLRERERETETNETGVSNQPETKSLSSHQEKHCQISSECHSRT